MDFCHWIEQPLSFLGSLVLSLNAFSSTGGKSFVGESVASFVPLDFDDESEKVTFVNVKAS